MNYRFITSCFWIGLLFLGTDARAAYSCDISDTTGYVPIPQPAKTGKYLVGAFRCSLWNQEERPGSWDPIKAFPERKPVLGWYNEGTPEVTDWEIKYAVEHGISFFVECWFRKKDNAGKPVEAVLDGWLHDGFFKSKYQDSMKFMILWENLNKIASGVSSEEDMLQNLLPYWINNFFTKNSYLKIDGKPVLMVYGYDKLIRDLGGKEKAAQIIRLMKQACVKAGLNGLLLMAESHGNVSHALPDPKDIGFDVITSYHWPSFSGLMPKPHAQQATIIRDQTSCWQQLQKQAGLPAVATMSMGWDSRPWGSSYYKGAWYLEPAYFQKLCQFAKAWVDKPIRESAFSNMVLIDNWNEFGEGHYIFPHQKFGFGYLDAIRSVFSTSTEVHTDIIPEDIGLGPY